MTNLRGALMGRFPGLESDVRASDDDLEIEAPTEGVDDTGAQLDGENIVEGDLVEAAEESREVEDADDEAGELEDTAEALESFLLAAQLGQKQGGWSDREAIAYSMGIDVAMKRIGLDHSVVVPSLESFNGNERQRIDACASVENKIKDALMAIWDAIKRAVNKVMAFIKKWWVKIFDGASRLKKRAEAIRKKAENTSGSAKEKKITTSTFPQLHIAKAMPNSTALVNAINGMTDSIKTITAGQMDKGYGDVVDTLVDNLQKFADADGAGNAVEAYSVIAGKGISLVKSMGLSYFTDNMSDDDKTRFAAGLTSVATSFGARATKELPGGKMMYYFAGGTNSAKGDNNGQLGRNIASLYRLCGKVGIGDFQKKKVEIDNSKEVSILEIGQVIEVCDAVIDMCQPIIDYKLGFANYEKKNSAALGKVDAVLRKANNGKADDKNERDRAELTRGLAQAIGSIVRNRGTSISNLVNYSVSLGRNALIFGVQSLAQYKD